MLPNPRVRRNSSNEDIVHSGDASRLDEPAGEERGDDQEPLDTVGGVPGIQIQNIENLPKYFEFFARF